MQGGVSWRGRGQPVWACVSCDCARLCDEGGDWDRRNRLKVYEGLYLMSIRNLKRASELFVDALPTFTCTEVRSAPHARTRD